MRRLLLALMVVGMLLAGIGVDLITPFGSPQAERAAQQVVDVVQAFIVPKHPMRAIKLVTVSMPKSAFVRNWQRDYIASVLRAV